MRALVAVAALALSGCVASTRANASRNLSALESDELVIVGTVEVLVDEADSTEHTTLETDGGDGSLQLDASGDVIWVVGRPDPGTSLHLSFIATPYSEGALALGERAVLVSANASPGARCSYFGTITIRVRRGPHDDAAEAYVGWSLPEGDVTRRTDDPQHRSSLANRYPSLGGLTCEVTTGGTVELGAP